MTKLNQLTNALLGRAILFDVEMRQVDSSPAMAGVSCDSEFEQVVFDERLAEAAKYRNLRVVDASDYLGTLVSKAETENRLLIAYSVHERDLLSALLPASKAVIEDRYCNANLRKWMKRTFPEEYDIAEERERKRLVANRCLPPSGWVSMGLKQLLKMPIVAYPDARSAGIGSPAGALQYVRGHSSPLTKAAKRKWSSLLTYNRHDVLGMEHLLRFMINHE